MNLVLFGRPAFESRWWPGSNYTTAEGPQGPFEPTKGHVVDPLAFSYRDIQPVYERMRAAGARILGEPEIDPEHGFKRFFVLAPDDLLIEIVQERFPTRSGISGRGRQADPAIFMGSRM